jgi:hypothetical protein
LPEKANRNVKDPAFIPCKIKVKGVGLGYKIIPYEI